jgi:putative glycosyltransferase (TIGR04372 family)
MSRLPELRGVIDYAHHPIRSARLDVILCARARFFLGTTSGLFYVSTVFGVPCALANMVPTSVMAPLASDISIPKLLYDERTSRLLRFDEILGSPVGNFLYTKLYTDAGIRIIENTPEDIRELASEMLDRLEGKHVENPEDEELQERFRRLLKPGTYSYGAASRVGTAFLRKYRHLLPA